jgi:hypothetical protein
MSCILLAGSFDNEDIRPTQCRPWPPRLEVGWAALGSDIPLSSELSPVNLPQESVKNWDNEETELAVTVEG